MTSVSSQCGQLTVCVHKWSFFPPLWDVSCCVFHLQHVCSLKQLMCIFFLFLYFVFFCIFLIFFLGVGEGSLPLIFSQFGIFSLLCTAPLVSAKARFIVLRHVQVTIQQQLKWKYNYSGVYNKAWYRLNNTLVMCYFGAVTVEIWCWNINQQDCIQWRTNIIPSQLYCHPGKGVDRHVLAQWYMVSPAASFLPDSGSQRTCPVFLQEFHSSSRGQVEGGAQVHLFDTAGQETPHDV